MNGKQPTAASRGQEGLVNLIQQRVGSVLWIIGGVCRANQGSAGGKRGFEPSLPESLGLGDVLCRSPATRKLYRGGRVRERRSDA
jgi:hypothetical protein